ncbi:hypothetical protein [Clostridium sp.]|nr:hypothetical protein [Clostridium sp.]
MGELESEIAFYSYFSVSVVTEILNVKCFGVIGNKWFKRRANEWM